MSPGAQPKKTASRRESAAAEALAAFDTEFFRALAEPSRLELLRVLALLADVAEHQDRAGGAACVQHRRHRVLDRDRRAVVAPEQLVGAAGALALEQAAHDRRVVADQLGPVLGGVPHLLVEVVAEQALLTLPLATYMTSFPAWNLANLVSRVKFLVDHPCYEPRSYATAILNCAAYVAPHLTKALVG